MIPRDQISTCRRKTFLALLLEAPGGKVLEGQEGEQLCQLSLVSVSFLPGQLPCGQL
jgi:hypothetical protein